jgi:hypothetical protein
MILAAWIRTHLDFDALSTLHRILQRVFLRHPIFYIALPS